MFDMVELKNLLQRKFIIKEEVHDHRKGTKLVMSLQSSEIKLAGAILLRVLTLK